MCLQYHLCIASGTGELLIVELQVDVLFALIRYSHHLIKLAEADVIDLIAILILRLAEHLFHVVLGHVER